MCEEGCVCERERVGGGGGDKWRNDRKGKVCHSPQRYRAQGIVVKSQPIDTQTIYFSFFTLDPCLYLVFAKSQGNDTQGSLPGPFLQCPGFHQFPRSPCNTPCNEFFFVFSKELTCHQNSIIRDARWFQKKDVNISWYSLHYFVFEVSIISSC